MSRLEITALPGLPVIKCGDDLAVLVQAGLHRAGIVLQPHDVLVFAQKVISKAEGRRVALASVVPSPRAMELADVAQKDPRVVELILAESRAVLRCRPGVIIVEDRRGFVMANAGIDASNVEGDDHVLLLPENPDLSAARLGAALGVAVIINDSFGRAWRLGTCGTAIGVTGMPALLDLRGRPDRNGRALQTSELALADEVAAAASLLMGQADEGRPVVHLRGVPGVGGAGQAADLIRPKHMDLFR
ncbi:MULTISPECIES: coenzyme F420-0:L-glutamate ligase [unclassified Chelatococcus]|uniref:coenzyme F420-0:L-glutamate ligase n=1 Tax=unclassified Chelatococcus TaxID=2638111 RepID=UPI001BCD20FB|nr:MULTISPECIES: coenzyme F420-0:L-glutamate ligase [unclassified Chelatococcus]MBS7700250.1 coenzyme F420-0:L-glutamate ligase [Chelatococcus sp. YT9]MBX3558221.1 coenzyme F420-0:L-glutamate ligase [Chelatococcus sp.]